MKKDIITYRIIGGGVFYYERVILLQPSLKNSYVLKIFADTNIDVHIIQFLFRCNALQQVPR